MYVNFRGNLHAIIARTMINFDYILNLKQSRERSLVTFFFTSFISHAEIGIGI